MRVRLWLVGPIAIVASFVLAASASAAGETAQVTTNTDTGSVSGCELRDAITAVTANATVGGCPVVDTNGLDDHVTFAQPMSGQTITLGGSGEIVINDPEDLDITGPGMNQLTVSGNDLTRIFNVQTPTSISGMSMVHGLAPVASGTAQGGAINSTASGPFSLVLTDVEVADSAATATDSSALTAFADGGAIHSKNGRLSLNRSVVTGNSATATQTGGMNHGAEARGGAIFNEDDITITDSTISGNQAASTTNGTGQAAAIAGIRSDGTLGMSGSTMSGNVASATATTGAARARGALYENGVSGASDVEQSTIAANKADATGTGAILQAGGLDLQNDTAIRSSTIALNGPDTATNVDGANILIEGGTNEIINTIIADPRGGGLNCVSPIPSDGFNDDFSPGGASCFSPPLMSDTAADPLLSTAGLVTNGPTQVIALQPGSPLIDAGTSSGLTDPTHDQRGVTRPVDFSGIPNAADGSDVGAFEVQLACAGQATPSIACSSGGGPTTVTPIVPVTPVTPTTPAKKKCKKSKKASAAKKKKCKKHKK